jgi:hypothetical protein
VAVVSLVVIPEGDLLLPLPLSVFAVIPGGPRHTTPTNTARTQKPRPHPAQQPKAIL